MDAHTDHVDPLGEQPEIELPPIEAEEVARPGFAWGRFFGHLGSVVVVLMLAGIGAAAYWGWTPLERRTRESVGVPISRIDIEWPRIGGARQGASPAAGKTAPTAPTPAETREVNRADKGKGGKGAKKAPAVQVVPAPWTAPDEATTWLPEQFQEQLLDRAKAALGSAPDPMSRDPLLAVAESLEQSGWFVGRPAVERRPGGVLSVHGTWRVPAAVVREGQKDVLISWDSTPLPVEYRHGQSNLPVIVGVPTPAPTKDGARDYSKAWPGEELEAAMELLKTVALEPWCSQVSGVDASKYRDTRRLVLTTTPGGRVVWGGRASKPLAGEASTKNKLARLASVNRKFGRIDAGLDGGAQELEIFWGQGPLVLNIAATNQGQLVEAKAP